MALAGYPASPLAALSLVSLPQASPLLLVVLVVVTLAALLLLSENFFAVASAFGASLAFALAVVSGVLQPAAVQLAAFALAGALSVQGVFSAAEQLRLVASSSGATYRGSAAAGTDAAALVSWLPAVLARRATPLAAVLLLCVCLLLSLRAALLVLAAAFGT